MSTERASEAAILVSVARTLRETVMPAIDDSVAPVDAYVRATIVQLIGIVEQASTRTVGSDSQRSRELTRALDHLASNPIVVGGPAGDPFATAARALVDCVGRTDAAADEVRAALRPVLVAQLDDELAQTICLMDAFRGRLGDA